MAPHRGRCTLLNTMAGWLLSQPTDALFLWRAPPCRRLGSADSGKSHEIGWFGGTPISGSHHIATNNLKFYQGRWEPLLGSPRPGSQQPGPWCNLRSWRHLLTESWTVKARCNFWSDPQKIGENIWLVVWLPFSIFPYIGNFISPIDELIFFRGVAQPPTRKNMVM